MYDRRNHLKITPFKLCSTLAISLFISCSVSPRPERTVTSCIHQMLQSESRMSLRRLKGTFDDKSANLTNEIIKLHLATDNHINIWLILQLDR